MKRSDVKSTKTKLHLTTLVILVLCANISQLLTTLPYPTLDSRSRTPIMAPLGFATLTSPPGTILSRIDGIRENSSGTQPPPAPDPQIAAGPNHVVEIANTMVEIFSKQGVSLKNSTFNAFFNTSSTTNDPRVIYDAPSERWFASIPSKDQGIRLAVSTTNDPTGLWKYYNFPACNGDDIPSLGINDDKIVISANSAPNSYICIANKSELVAGVPTIDFAFFNAPYYAVYAVQSLSPTTTEYMVSTGNSPTNVTRLYAIHGTPPGNLSITLTNLPINATSLPTNLPQFAGYDTRVLDAAWFKGKLWYALNDGCTPPNDSQSWPCIRLTEINTNSSRVLQDFDYGVASQSTYYPALRIDGNGSLDVVYGFTGGGIAVTGQAANEPVKSLRQPATLKTGNGARTDYWGDYFGAGADPSDNRTVWVAGEYVPNNHALCPPGTGNEKCWGTFIGSMSIQPFTLSVSPAALNMVAPSPGSISTGHANLTVISSLGFSGQITLSNSPNYMTATSGPLLSYSQTTLNMTPGQTITIVISASICSSTPSRTFKITGTSAVFTNNVTFTVNITGQRSGSCPS